MIIEAMIAMGVWYVIVWLWVGGMIAITGGDDSGMTVSRMSVYLLCFYLLCVAILGGVILKVLLYISILTGLWVIGLILYLLFLGFLDFVWDPIRGKS